MGLVSGFQESEHNNVRAMCCIPFFFNLKNCDTDRMALSGTRKAWRNSQCPLSSCSLVPQKFRRMTGMDFCSALKVSRRSLHVDGFSPSTEKMRS
jgi:hypothetical protein